MQAEDRATVNLAMGRIFGMMQRPERDGDAAEYWRCRSLILDLIGDPVAETRPSLAGAAGDYFVNSFARAAHPTAA